MQASAKGLTRDTKRGGKYMAIDSGDDEEGVVEVESISSDDEEMDASGSRSGSSRADSQMNSTKPPSPSPDPEDRLDNNPQEETVAPESDDVGNESANSSRTIVDNEGSEAEPVLQGESSDRESIHPAPTMCRADAAVGAEIDMAVKMEEQEEEVPDITGASVTTTDQAMPLSATLDNEGPFFNTVSGRYQSHPPPQLDEQSHMARSPTLPRGFQQALQEIEDDLNSQQEERYFSHGPRFGEFSSESP